MTASVAAPATAPARPRWWRDRRRLPWWRIPLYPALFLPVMILLTWGQTGVHPALVVRPLLVALGFSLALTLLIAFVVKDRDRAGLAAAAILVMLLALDDRAAVMLFVAAVAIIVEGVIHRGRPAIMASIATQVMSAVATILVIATVITLVGSGALSGAFADLTNPPLPPIGQAAGVRPDIYLFLLDAYPGDRAAARATAFDAEAFPKALTARGFDVDRDTHSNYLLTPLTLASMLSMRHLIDIPALDPPYTSRGSDWYRVRMVLESAPAFEVLRQAGYEVDVIDGGYAHPQMRRVDRFFEQPGPQELELILMKYSRIEGLVEAIAPGTLAAAARGNVEHAFAMAATLAAERTGHPRFIFTHVPAPHPPWVYEADGSPRLPGSLAFGGEPMLTDQEALDAGFAQATHVADLTVQAIDEIDAAAPSPPVVIVMSDHGPKGGVGTIEDLDFDIEVRASAFMSARTPGHPGLFDEAPTPVNLFPTLFDAYLGIHVDRQSRSVWAWNDSYLDAVEAPRITGWAP